MGPEANNTSVGCSFVRLIVTVYQLNLTGSVMKSVETYLEAPTLSQSRKVEGHFLKQCLPLPIFSLISAPGPKMSTYAAACIFN